MQNYASVLEEYLVEDQKTNKFKNVVNKLCEGIKKLIARVINKIRTAFIPLVNKISAMKKKRAEKKTEDKSATESALDKNDKAFNSASDRLVIPSNTYKTLQSLEQYTYKAYKLANKTYMEIISGAVDKMPVSIKEIDDLNNELNDLLVEMRDSMQNISSDKTTVSNQELKNKSNMYVTQLNFANQIIDKIQKDNYSKSKIKIEDQQRMKRQLLMLISTATTAINAIIQVYSQILIQNRQGNGER